MVLELREPRGLFGLQGTMSPGGWSGPSPQILGQSAAGGGKPSVAWECRADHCGLCQALTPRCPHNTVSC